MKVQIARDIEATRKLSWQTPFNATEKCVHCGGEARLAFVAHEDGKEKEKVHELYPNNGGEGGDYWLHDACAVAVYLCTKCLKPTAEYNQG